MSDDEKSVEGVPIDVDALAVFTNVADVTTSEMGLLPVGLTQTEVSFSGTFEPISVVDEAVREVSLSLTPSGPVRSQYSGHKLTFDAVVALAGTLDEALLKLNKKRQPFVMWFPVTDRRVARRIARREHMKFTKHGKTYVLRSRA